MSEYPFLFAKIRGKLAQVKHLAVHEELLESADLEAVLRRLGETPYSDQLDEKTQHPDDRVLQDFLAEIPQFLRVLNEEDKSLVQDVMAKYHLENLKAAIRAHLHGLPPEEVAQYLLELPWERIDFKEWLRLPGLEALIGALPWPEERQRLATIGQQVGQADNPFPYEVELDALYLERLLEHRARRGHWVEEILGNRVLKELVLWSYRLKSFGHSFPEIVNIFPDFRSLVSQEELGQILETDAGWLQLRKWLDGSLAGELERAEQFDPDLMGRLFDEQLILSVKRLLLLAVADIAVVLGYLYWKELEIRGVIGLLERAR